MLRSASIETSHARMGGCFPASSWVSSGIMTYWWGNSTEHPPWPGTDGKWHPAATPPPKGPSYPQPLARPREAALCATEDQQHLKPTALPWVLPLPSPSPGMNNLALPAGLSWIWGETPQGGQVLAGHGRAPAVFYAARAGNELQQWPAALITQPDKSHTAKS